MADFAAALKRTLGYEGGFSNDPGDSGGKTRYGITEAEARAAGYAGRMEDFPLDEAKKIYRARYWDRILGDSVRDQAIAEELFDTAVNCGVVTAVTILQRSLNVHNDRAKRWADVKADGLMGPATVGVLDAALTSGMGVRDDLLRTMNCLQGARYVAIAENDPAKEAFVRGWIRNRVKV